MPVIVRANARICAARSRQCCGSLVSSVDIGAVPTDHYGTRWNLCKSAVAVPAAVDRLLQTRPGRRLKRPLTVAHYSDSRDSCTSCLTTGREPLALGARELLLAHLLLIGEMASRSRNGSRLGLDGKTRKTRNQTQCPLATSRRRGPSKKRTLASLWEAVSRRWRFLHAAATLERRARGG